MMHDTEHPLAGTDVITKYGVKFRIDDWYDRVHGISWKHSGHEIAVNYYVRQVQQSLPGDDNVVYGRFEDNTESLLHTSELQDFTGWG